MLFAESNCALRFSNMLKQCVVLLLFLNFVRTTENVYSSEILNGRVAEYNKRFSLWPSVHNAASLVRVRREVEQASAVIPETKVDTEKKENKTSLVTPLPSPTDSKNPNEIKVVTNSSAAPSAVKTTISTEAPITNNTETKVNSTKIVEKAKDLDLNDPGVLKRGFIVFGGFALLAIAYFIFYRRKGKNNDTSNNTNDTNQFRYGVLQSEDRRDNLELSRIPLTMESDDDEDEDLEIFDLEQKRKSLSYVNLQTNDEDVVFSNKENYENDKDNLLLDIEDGTSETLINWSSNGNKSIL